ncbi:hypothetical protein [Paenibacillus sambharensis]|uniref:hypothetical protein n=1 Tax=Paenibacillus sambharensis TaxID=1803190 RepID=UPI0015E8DFBB|nr:hypothetical protein [Paenibacillus sambharensis]
MSVINRKFRKALSALLVLSFLSSLFVGMGTTSAAPIPGTITLTADNEFTLYHNGNLIGSGNNWYKAYSFNLTITEGKNVIAVRAKDVGSYAGLLADITYQDENLVTDFNWKASGTYAAGWEKTTFNDDAWSKAQDNGRYGVTPWNTQVSGMPADTTARWIWSSKSYQTPYPESYFRLEFTVGADGVSVLDPVETTGQFDNVEYQLKSNTPMPALIKSKLSIAANTLEAEAESGSFRLLSNEYNQLVPGLKAGQIYLDSATGKAIKITSLVQMDATSYLVHWAAPAVEELFEYYDIPAQAVSFEEQNLIIPTDAVAIATRESVKEALDLKGTGLTQEHEEALPAAPRETAPEADAINEAEARLKANQQQEETDLPAAPDAANQEAAAEPEAVVEDEPEQVEAVSEAAQPQAVEPQAAEPQAAEPQAVEPQAAEPQAAEPQVAEPQVAEPQVAQPQAAEPQAVAPEMEADQRTADASAAAAGDFTSCQKTGKDFKCEFKKVLINQQGTNGKVYVEAGGSITLLTPKITGVYNRKKYDLKFTAGEKANVYIKGEAKFKKDIKIPLFGFEADAGGLGKASVGVFLVIGVDGSVTFEFQVNQGYTVEAGVRGKNFLYVPTSVTPYSNVDRYLTTTYNIEGQIKASAGAQAEAGLTIARKKILEVTVFAGIVGEGQWTSGTNVPTKITLSIDAVVKANAAVLKKDYQLFYISWPLVRVEKGPAPNANHAIGAAVSADSTFPGYSVARINDGDRNTALGQSYSWANNQGAPLPQHVYMNFGANKTISKVDLYTSQGYVMANYDIQYWNGSSWVTVATVTGNTSTYRSHSFNAVSTSQIRVVCRRGPSHQTNYVRINELEVY